MRVMRADSLVVHRVLGCGVLTTESDLVPVVSQASPPVEEGGSFSILPVVGVSEEDVIQPERGVDIRQMQPVLALLPIEPPQVYSEKGVGQQTGRTSTGEKCTMHAVVWEQRGGRNERMCGGRTYARFLQGS